MNRPPKIISILIVLITISAWLAISNHCALGAVTPEAKPSAEECPFHAKQHAPTKQKQSNGLTCCKILRATAPSPAKSFAGAIANLPHVDLVFAKLIVLAPPKISFHSSSLDNGPPGVTSFVELIGSMRAHAPPLFA